MQQARGTLTGHKVALCNPGDAKDPVIMTLRKANKTVMAIID